MTRSRLLSILCVALIAAFAIGAFASPAAAHETDSDEGYEFLFGGEDEPMITDERMWLEVEITDEETGEPAEDLEEGDLTITVHSEADRVDETYEADMDARFGEAGWYEAPVLFTEPGRYVFVIEGTIDGDGVRVEFTGDHFEVQDRSELYYPAADQAAAGGDDTDGPAAGEDDGGDAIGADGSGFGAIAAALSIGVLSALLYARRQ